jgi:hypothetical protein
MRFGGKACKYGSWVGAVMFTIVEKLLCHRCKRVSLRGSCPISSGDRFFTDNLSERSEAGRAVKSTRDDSGFCRIMRCRRSKSRGRERIKSLNLASDASEVSGPDLNSLRDKEVRFTGQAG